MEPVPSNRQRLPLILGYAVAIFGLAMVVRDPSWHMATRWLVCGGNVLVVFTLTSRTRSLLVGHAVVALLFNPVVPLFLHNRSIWLVIDFAAFGFLMISAAHAFFRQPSSPRAEIS